MPDPLHLPLPTPAGTARAALDAAEHTAATVAELHGQDSHAARWARYVATRGAELLSRSRGMERPR